MRLISTIFSLLFVTAASLAVAADNGQSGLVPGGRGDSDGAQSISFQTILVIASDSGTTDSSLSAHEATLKRVLRFKSFRRAGGGSSRPLAANGETTISIGGGYELDLWVNWMTDREVEFGVRWFKGKLTLANMTLTRPRRSTSVVLGPATEDGSGTYAVLVTTR